MTVVLWPLGAKSGHVFATFDNIWPMLANIWPMWGSAGQTLTNSDHGGILKTNGAMLGSIGQTLINSGQMRSILAKRWTKLARQRPTSCRHRTHCVAIVSLCPHLPTHRSEFAECRPNLGFGCNRWTQFGELSPTLGRLRSGISGRTCP